MNTGLFNVLHDRTDHHLLTITDGIYIHFNRMGQVEVEQYRTLVGDLHRLIHVAVQLHLVIDDLHGAATQYIGRTHHQWVANLLGLNDGLFHTAHGGVGGLGQIQLLNHLLKTFAIFGHIDGFRAGTDDLHTGRFQRQGQLKRGLTTVLDDHTIGLFHINNGQHIFKGDRLKVETIGGVVVGRYGFRITVDHNGLVTIFAHGQGRVHTAVVELDTLTDTVRATANHHNLFASRGRRLALFLIGGVHVSGVGGKLCRTGIHPFEHRTQTQFMAMITHRRLFHFQQRGQTGITKAFAL